MTARGDRVRCFRDPGSNYRTGSSAPRQTRPLCRRRDSSLTHRFIGCRSVEAGGELLKIDVIVAPNTPAARAAPQATTTIPIVVPIMGDLVGDGRVSSLARPGGNITGLTFLGPELLPKRLALLKDALPKVSNVAALWHPS